MAAIIIFILFIMTVLLAYFHNSNQVILINNTDMKKLQDYSFKYNKSKSDLDIPLMNKKFCYFKDTSTDQRKECISVITYRKGKAHFKEYMVSDNDTISLDIPEDESFIISLYANSTITYTWNTSDYIDKNILNYIKKTRIQIYGPGNDGATGVSYDRENLYFKPSGKGDVKILIKYEHETQKSNPTFNINFDINII